MKYKQIWAVSLVWILFATGCSKEKGTIDDIPPVIDIGYTQAFPKQCSSVQRGKAFIFKARLSDNVALGGFSLDIHHNFDHHNHSTEVGECTPGPVKTPVKPFVWIRSYEIPAGLKQYEAEVEITVPSDIDTGDYHFMIMVSDKTGWSTMKGLSIRITE